MNDRLASVPIEPLRHLNEQQTHTLCDEGALEERGSVLIFARGLASTDGRDIGGKLRLLECAFEHIGMRNNDLSPRFQAHRFILRSREMSVLR